MYYAIITLVFFHAAFAGMRTLPEGEALAFKALFGTSDIQKLSKIEKDPAAYWDEREKALKDEAMTHIKFCELYTQEAQDLIQDANDNPEYEPWFCRRPDMTEQHIKDNMGEGHPAYPTAVAFFTALACDHMYEPRRDGPTLMTQCMQCTMDFCPKIDRFKEYEGLSHDLNERLRWIICDNAEFSIFDSLIMLSNQEYLCAAAPRDHRRWYKSHQKADGTYEFWGVHGPIFHDVIAHAQRQYLLEYALCAKGISQHEYFKKCWNKKSLIKKNIFALAEQSLGCYYNFHELATVNGAWKHDDLRSLIFPNTSGLTDSGFLQIVPYFTTYKCQCPGFDWRKTPVEVQPKDDMQTHGALLYFRSKYCGVHGEAILADEHGEAILARATRQTRTCTLL